MVKIPYNVLKSILEALKDSLRNVANSFKREYNDKTQNKELTVWLIAQRKRKIQNCPGGKWIEIKW